MGLKLEMLRSFATVARNGNLGDAARDLGRTTSAVSMTLKQLEEHLGEPLFETDRKNKLTALGMFVLEQAERELKQFDDAVLAIESFAKARRGHIRIAAVPSVASSILPRVFARHMNDFADVDIELRDMDSASILHELTHDRVDIGIATVGEGNPGLDSQLLLADSFGVVCPKEHPLSQGQVPLRWRDLKGERLIANSLSKAIDNEFARELHVTALMTVQNLTSLTAMVREGVGITILPQMAIQNASFADLGFRMLAEPVAKRRIHLLKKAKVTLSPSAKALERHILAYVLDD